MPVPTPTCMITRGNLKKIKSGDYVLVNTRTNEDRSTFREAPPVLFVDTRSSHLLYDKKNPMITHKERIQTSINNEMPDRPPVALWRHFPVDDQTPETLAAATLNFQQSYDFDLVKVTPASSFCLRDWGVEDEWIGDTEGTRRYTKHAIQDPRDWEKLPALDPDRAASRRTTGLSPFYPRRPRPGHSPAADHLQPAGAGQESGGQRCTDRAFAFVSRSRDERTCHHYRNNASICGGLSRYRHRRRFLCHSTCPGRAY